MASYRSDDIIAAMKAGHKTAAQIAKAIGCPPGLTKQLLRDMQHDNRVTYDARLHEWQRAHLTVNEVVGEMVEDAMRSSGFERCECCQGTGWVKR